MVSLVDSLVAPMSVVNALIVALASRREHEVTKTFESLERLWEEYNVYEKRVEDR
jgi:DNA-binding MurR/RpiR family transcriptional regulator